MPRQTRVSLRDGRYSTICPSADGTKPGMMRPKPFSIQMPMKHATQARFKPTMRRLQGETSSTSPMKSSAMALQIHGTNA